MLADQHVENPMCEVPNRRPEPVTSWHLGRYFNSAIPDSLFASCGQSSRPNRIDDLIDRRVADFHARRIRNEDIFAEDLFFIGVCAGFRCSQIQGITGNDD
jgi:hypothetical protein